MKRTIQQHMTFLCLAAAAACGDSHAADNPDASNGDFAAQTIVLSDDITTNTVFTAANTYIVPRGKQLFVKPDATLIIRPGTVVKAEQGSMLVVARGAKLIADGTLTKPIVLTTAQPDGQKTRGYWGGLVVLGEAPINNNALSSPASNEATFEAFSSSMPEGKFGGDYVGDSSGVIRYVRIEFAGFNFLQDREFSNLTLCGVGSGTVVDYVQVHSGSADGIEVFGGTVNVKHIVSSQNGGDGFNISNGWRGKAQFVVVQNATPNATQEASNGFQSDNHATAASYAAEPRTLPTVYNISLFGNHNYTAGAGSYAMVLRRGTGGHYYNVVAAGFPSGIEIRGQITKEQLEAGNLFFKNSIFFGNAIDGNNWPPAQANDDIDESSYFTNTAWANRFVDPGMNAARLSLSGPDFAPIPTGAAMIGAATPPNDGFFDSTATFVGAIGTTDWTQGWTSYPQQEH